MEKCVCSKASFCFSSISWYKLYPLSCRWNVIIAKLKYITYHGRNIAYICYFDIVSFFVSVWVVQLVVSDTKWVNKLLFILSECKNIIGIRVSRYRTTYTGCVSSFSLQMFCDRQKRFCARSSRLPRKSAVSRSSCDNERARNRCRHGCEGNFDTRLVRQLRRYHQPALLYGRLGPSAVLLPS